MIPQPVRDWLTGYYSEDQLRAMVKGTRQNWYQRRIRLREVAGLELLPGTWLYRRAEAEAYLARTRG